MFLNLKMIRLICALAFVATFAATGIGQEKKQEKEVNETTGFKGQIFELKFREPSEIYQTLSPLGSGFKGAMITINDELNTLTVRDFPENIAAIGEAIKRLDVPRVARAESSVELTMQVLLADTTESPSHLPGEIPNDLKDVVKQLQNTFTFKNYNLATTIVQRAKAHIRRGGHPALAGGSDATWVEPLKESDGTVNKHRRGTQYNYEVTDITFQPGSSGSATAIFQNFTFRFGKTSIQTNLEVRDGEKLVVGTASFGEKAMILVLSVKVLK